MKKLSYPEQTIAQIINILDKPEGITTRDKSAIIEALSRGEVIEEKEEKPKSKK